MKLRGSVVGVLAAGALLLTGCAGESNDSAVGEVVVVTETVTEEAVAAPRPFYTQTVSWERYGGGDSGYHIASPDGVISCQLVDQLGRGPLPEYGGGCVNGTVDEPRGPTVMLYRTDADRLGTLLEDGGYPGYFFTGNPRLEVGEVVSMSTLLCFAPAESSLGCVDLQAQNGFLISGKDVRHFGARDYPEIFDNDGVMEIISPRTRLQFDNGGSVICFQSEDGTQYTCGDAFDLDFPDMEGSAVQSNAVFFDISGPTPVVRGHNASNVGIIGVTAQPTGPGTYFHYGMTIEHDGHRATFTTPAGGRFWVGVDGFGVL